jgi:hypothetical protein
MNDTETEVLISGYRRSEPKNKSWLSSPTNVLILIILIFQLLIFTMIALVIYKAHSLDVGTINSDSRAVAKILSNNGTEKIINVLENINITDYSRYVDKLRHIIDDACYYVFNCYGDENDYTTLKNLTL